MQWWQIHQYDNLFVKEVVMLINFSSPGARVFVWEYLFILLLCRDWVFQSSIIWRSWLYTDSVTCRVLGWRLCPGLSASICYLHLGQHARLWYRHERLGTDLMFLLVIHDDVIKWKHFPCYWPFVWGIHRSPVNSPHKGQWCRALMFTLICALNKWLSKQSWGWWFETPLRPLWRHCNVIPVCGWLSNSKALSNGITTVLY